MGEGEGTTPIRVFVSHAADDTEVADGLRDLVTTAFGPVAVTVFASSRRGRRITAGEPWAPHLLDEMRRTDVLLALVTPSFLASTFCAVELGVFWALGAPMVPILVGVDAVPPTHHVPLGDFEPVDHDDEAPDRIVEAIRRHRPDARTLPHRRQGTTFLARAAAAAGPSADRVGPAPARPRGVGAVATADDLTVVLPSGDGLSVLQRSWAGGTSTRRRLALPTAGPEPRTVGVGTYAGVGPHVEVFVATGDRQIDHVVDAGAGFGRWRTMTHPPRATLAELHPVSRPVRRRSPSTASTSGAPSGASTGRAATATGTGGRRSSGRRRGTAGRRTSSATWR